MWAYGRLGRRYYRDELDVVATDPDNPTRKPLPRLREVAEPDGMEPDTDIAAIAEGKVAVHALHFDLTHHDGVQSLVEHDLERLLREPLRRAVPVPVRRRARPGGRAAAARRPSLAPVPRARRP